MRLLQPLCREDPWMLKKPWAAWKCQPGFRRVHGFAGSHPAAQSSVTPLHIQILNVQGNLGGHHSKLHVSHIMASISPGSFGTCLGVEMKWNQPEGSSHLRAFLSFQKEVSNVCMCSRKWSGQRTRPQSNSSSALGMRLVFRINSTRFNVLCVLD